MKVAAFKIWLEYFTGSGCFNSAISTLQFTLKPGFLKLEALEVCRQLKCFEEHVKGEGLVNVLESCDGFC